jgi:DNA-binding response OmpR family regulator
MTFTRPIDPETPERRRAHVLVAANDSALTTAIQRALVEEGHRVTVATDGLDLLERLSERDAGQLYQLVLAEVELDGFTGLEVLGMTEAAPARPPVVLIAPRVDLPMRMAGRQFGASSVISSPLDPQELLRTVAAILGAASRAPTRAA